MNYKSKRIYLNTKRTKYCVVKLFSTKLAMQDYYKAYCDKYHKQDDQQHYKCLGVSLQYVRVCDYKTHPETGQVLLNVNNCGASIVAHELTHAVLWAHKHRRNKAQNQYPIVIKDMKEEEVILYNLTFAIQQFYKWYWKLVKEPHN